MPFEILEFCGLSFALAFAVGKPQLSPEATKTKKRQETSPTTKNCLQGTHKPYWPYFLLRISFQVSFLTDWLISLGKNLAMKSLRRLTKGQFLPPFVILNRGANVIIVRYWQKSIEILEIIKNFWYNCNSFEQGKSLKKFFNSQGKVEKRKLLIFHNTMKR